MKKNKEKVVTTSVKKNTEQLKEYEILELMGVNRHTYYKKNGRNRQR